jgi:hypothetical protein
MLSSMFLEKYVVRLELDETGSGSCLTTGFGISGVPTELVSCLFGKPCLDVMCPTGYV